MTLELELFFKQVESEIRSKHIKYLKKQKCISAAKQFPANLEQSSDVEKEINIDDFPIEGKRKYVKRFNNGIEIALQVLQKEYKKFAQRFESDEKGKKRF